MKTKRFIYTLPFALTVLAVFAYLHERHLEQSYQSEFHNIMTFVVACEYIFGLLCFVGVLKLGPSVKREQSKTNQFATRVMTWLCIVGLVASAALLCLSIFRR